MKIRYEHDGISLMTKCPHGMYPKVGSISCHLCKWFDSDGYPEENCIICNYKEE